MYYRLSNDIRIVFLKFFQVLFSLYSENKISFVDGRANIVFERAPKVFDTDTYDFKYYPCILIGVSPGSFSDTHFNKYRGTDSLGVSGVPEHIYGGVVSLTITFRVYATTKEDRNNLADLLCIYLSKQETKEQFETSYGIRLKMPSFSGDNTEDDPQTNIKRFYTDITMPMEADFEERSAIIDTLGNTGLTVQDIISLIASTEGSGEITGF